MYKYKTAIAFATAASLSVMAGPLLAASDSAAQAGDAANQDAASYEDVHKQQPTAQVDAGFEPNFERLDQNQDGQLQDEELNAFGSTAAGMESDDILGSEENMNRGEQIRKRYDTDQSGAVSKEELQAGHKADMTKSGSQTK